ncbi:nuclear transport factor 2 family protein [Streptomyces hyaluromycini]|uniref:nuclear transport factor 2 family protein n=1 Tax=Streptomyces hyaluromycini TaxID=1377993 RepID=UPI000B5CF672|nr:limonene-1,2-epoxide hydrolase family protein [Streptomyces hyaluromycini]
MAIRSTRRGLFRAAGGASLGVIGLGTAGGPASAAPSLPETGGALEPGPGTALVQRFCAAWSNLDAAELAAFFAQDATYQNVPLPGVITGRDAIQQALAEQIRILRYTTLHIQKAVSWRNTVIAIRVDSYRYTNADHDVDLPIVGVFELTPDFRQFTSWVDYFDLGQSEFGTAT